MIIYYSNHGCADRLIADDLIVWHRNDLPNPCKFISTDNLENATYFIRVYYNHYVDLATVWDYDSYSTLRNLKLQYVPESLI